MLSRSPADPRRQAGTSREAAVSQHAVPHIFLRPTRGPPYLPKRDAKTTAATSLQAVPLPPPPSPESETLSPSPVPPSLALPSPAIAENPALIASLRDIAALQEPTPPLPVLPLLPALPPSPPTSLPPLPKLPELPPDGIHPAPAIFAFANEKKTPHVEPGAPLDWEVKKKRRWF